MADSVKLVDVDQFFWLLWQLIMWKQFM